MTQEQARALLVQAFTSLTTERETQNALEHYDQLALASPERAYAVTLTSLLSAAVLADYQHHIFLPEHRYNNLSLSLAEYNNTLPAEGVVQLLFSHAPTDVQQQLLHTLASGLLDINDLLFSWASLQNPATQAQLHWDDLWAQILHNPHVRAPGLLPLPELPLATPEPLDVQWIIGIYVAAFARAPEFSGLQYWAERLQELQQGNGLPRHEAIRELAREMDWAGRENQENGTGLSDAELVPYMYQQVLQRAPDPAGGTYWAGALADGSVDRGEFLGVFVNSALVSAGDGNLLRARIAVAAEAAHADLVGVGYPELDLVAVLHGVTDLVSALAAVASLQALTAHASPPLPASHPETDQTALLHWLLLAPEPGDTPDTHPQDVATTTTPSAPLQGASSDDLWWA